jgi:RNA polymerase sigma-70 factor, ECF subfamily
MHGVMTEPQRVPPSISEAALVRRVASGDEEAVGRFHQDYADAVFRFIYRRVGDSYEDAQELTLDVFLVAVNYAGTFDDSHPVLTWLCGIAKVRIADFYRRQGRHKRIPPARLLSLDALSGPGGGGLPVVDAEDVPGRLEAARVVDQVMAALREEEREVLMLRYVDGFSVREIGLLMGRTEKAIESLLMRAKRKAAHVAERLL